MRERKSADFDRVGSAELELELVELGLSGRRFGPREYADALEERLETKIVFRFVDDLEDPITSRSFASEGRLANARYLRHRNLVMISMPSDLSPFLLTLISFHELSHIAAGDLIGGKRLARRPPPRNEEAREEEADRRASHLYLSGSLGANNPCALEIHGVP